jgi:hypothetical protein
MQQLEEALVQARKEEKEATSARRALQSELEGAQVSTEAWSFLPHNRTRRYDHWSSPGSSRSPTITTWLLSYPFRLEVLN